MDSAGEAFVAGVSDGTNTLISLSTYQPVYGGGSSDAFVTKLNASGSDIVYSSYLGGIGADRANSIAVDRFGYAVVTGTTTATNFPHTRVYGTDLSSIAFITRFSPDGNKVSYSDMVLGPAGNAVATDSAGNAYVGGGTGSKFVPLVIPFQSSLKGTTDAWFGNANSTGTLTTSSYLGGSGGESGNAGLTGSVFDQAHH